MHLPVQDYKSMLNYSISYIAQYQCVQGEKKHVTGDKAMRQIVFQN